MKHRRRNSLASLASLASLILVGLGPSGCSGDEDQTSVDIPGRDPQPSGSPGLGATPDRPRSSPPDPAAPPPVPESVRQSPGGGVASGLLRSDRYRMAFSLGGDVPVGTSASFAINATPERP